MFENSVLYETVAQYLMLSAHAKLKNLHAFHYFIF